MSGEEESVKVAVRVRLFNKRETEANANLIIRMAKQSVGSNTYIKNPDSGEEKKFNFDYSFQTHSATQEGIGEYATQDTVFEELGRPLLTGALQGRNVCLFAYGQTGAGKSFSMLGAPGMPGIIPRMCTTIFEMINANEDKALEYAVDITVVEIYCEQLNDLLADRKTWPPGGLKPKLTNIGYVVDGVVTKPCFSYDDIQGAFDFSDRNRSVGSHALNPMSSRAHTIYTINYQRKKRHPTGKIVETITCRLNLVDLAGSERTGVAGTSGQMLKEGNAINLSLTALGQCIKTLSENKKPNFRDSRLTLLLQASMTNGRVVMIAAVSPANICYDESMSTLRFAERIKQVKIRVSKNVSVDPVAEMKKAMEAMRSDMQDEIDKLRARAAGHADPEAMEELQAQLKAQEEEREAMRAEYARKMAELEESAEERAKRAADIAQNQSAALGGACMIKKENMKEPHLLNLHEDPRLAETLVYPLKDGTTVVGRTNKDNPPDLEFNGMGMIKNHVTIERIDGKIWATPGMRSRTLVNGKAIDSKTELTHNCRVWLGNNYAFRFSYPGHEDEGEKFDEAPDYFFAEQEIAENASFEMTGTAADMIPSALNHKLSEALKKVEQANIIAMDLGQECEFEAKIFKNRITNENDVVVRVLTQKGELHWPWEKFNERLVDFSKEWQQWQYAEDKGEKYKRPADIEDPFEDADFQLIGEADVWLQSLANMIEHEADASILAITGQSEGRLKVDVLPCDCNGREGPWDDDEENDPFVDDPNELLGEEIQFCIKVHNIIFDTNITDSGQVCKFTNVWVRYKVDISNNEEEWSNSEEVAESTFNPKFNYRKVHKVKVDQHILHLLLKGRIIFQVWGKLSQDATAPASPRKGKLDPLDAQIAEKKRILEELDKEIAKKKALLA
eukprot:TRINITY_DN67977_c10_g3_i1.p1 TRINITY_DN67977_c10_g3~~TRINITY_DN67977_c10_g3_i1.p1  ORF type:complete len:904 (-),score=149.04 TRINITY_DN67977_c10_g3_i1:136-2847(-)